MRPPFHHTGDGVAVQLEAGALVLLQRLPAILDSVRGGDDPAFRRLHPSAYPNDEEAQAEYLRLVGSDLDAARDLDLRGFVEALERADDPLVISPAEAEAWVRVIGACRLVIASRLGVDAESDMDRLPEAESSLLMYLAYLQEELVAELSKDFEVTR